MQDGNRIVLQSDQVKNPVAVRYGWADNPDDVNLYNLEGLPASPFRTDEWPGITADR
jgi:sialate O-acetylesterase